PGPVTSTVSGTPSPLKSPVAARTSPARPGNGLSGLPDAASVPVASGTNTWAVPSAGPATAAAGGRVVSTIVTGALDGLPGRAPSGADTARSIVLSPSKRWSSRIVMANVAVAWPSTNGTVVGSP